MTLVGVALVPAAPVLVAELSGRLRPAMMPRDAARRVIEQLIATSPDLIVVVAEGDNDETFDETAAMHLHRMGGMRRDDYAPGARVLPVPRCCVTRVGQAARNIEPSPPRPPPERLSSVDENSPKPGHASVCSCSATGARAPRQRRQAPCIPEPRRSMPSSSARSRKVTCHQSSRGRPSNLWSSSVMPVCHCRCLREPWTPAPTLFL